MKKVWFVVLVAASWFLYVNRLRLFLRDPIAGVTRNGAKEAGAQVFLNFDNDILIENDRIPVYLLVVQHGQPVGAPAALKCLQYIACMAAGYPAPQTSALPGARVVAMTSKQVQFRDDEGRDVVVQLR